MSDFISIEISETTKSFEDVLLAQLVTAERIEHLQIADAVALPIRSFRDFQGPVYPHRTADFLHYAHAESNLKLEVTVTDEEYCEIALYHAEWIGLGTWLCSAGTLHALAKLINTYCAFLAQKRVKVTFKVTETAKKRCVEIHYEGPADKIVDRLQQIDVLQKIAGQQNPVGVLETETATTIPNPTLLAGAELSSIEIPSATEITKKKRTKRKKS